MESNPSRPPVPPTPPPQSPPPVSPTPPPQSPPPVSPTPPPQPPPTPPPMSVPVRLRGRVFVRNNVGEPLRPLRPSRPSTEEALPIPPNIRDIPYLRIPRPVRVYPNPGRRIHHAQQPPPGYTGEVQQELPTHEMWFLPIVSAEDESNVEQANLPEGDEEQRP